MSRIYLDGAATGLFDQTVLDVANEFTYMYNGANLTTKEIFRRQKASLVTARQAVASLLNCSPEEIALMQSTSHALGTLSACLPLKKGDNVLVCDMEYQASIVCWKAAMDKIGFELREVKTQNGEITAADFERYMDENTKVILLAAVQEVNGYRADVKAIGELAHRKGCYYIVDGVQEAGALKVDVKDLDVDFYCAGGKKWIGNPFGMGFLYIKKDLLKDIKPSYYSYYDIIVPPKYGDFQDYLENPLRHPFDDYNLVEDASVFEAGGFSNFLAAMALTKSISLLESIGLEKIEKHIFELNHYIHQQLSDMGMHMLSSADEAHMSSIIVFNINGLKNNNVNREKELLQFLIDRNIIVTLRCSTGMGGIRVSVHHYTKKEEVDVFLTAVREFLSQK